MKIHMSESTKLHLEPDGFDIELRGQVDIKVGYE